MLRPIAIVVVLSVATGLGIGLSGEQHFGRVFEIRAIFGFLCVFLPGCAYVIVSLFGRNPQGVERDQSSPRQVDRTASPLKRVLFRALAYFAAFCSAGLFVAVFVFLASGHRVPSRLDWDAQMIIMGVMAVLFVASIGTSVAIERANAQRDNGGG